MFHGLIVSVVLCLAATTPAGAEVLRFVGAFHTLYDCPDTGLGAARTGSPPPVTIDIPFSFTMEITQPFDYTSVGSTQWQSPEFPMPPPVTQALFESLSDHTFSRLGGANTYENGPVFKNLLSSAQRMNLWTGTDAQGRAGTTTTKPSTWGSKASRHGRSRARPSRSKRWWRCGTTTATPVAPWGPTATWGGRS